MPSGEPSRRRRGVVLIGMPGAGKSTVGVLLAKRLALGFIDTDLLIQERAGQTLQAILDRTGYLALRRIEEEVLLALDCRGHVVATGGSAVYSERGMRHLAAGATVVYLEVGLATLRARIHDYESRGIARRPGQSFAELFDERTALYRRYADITLACGDASPEAVMRMTVARLAGGDADESP